MTLSTTIVTITTPSIKALRIVKQHKDIQHKNTHRNNWQHKDKLYRDTQHDSNRYHNTQRNDTYIRTFNITALSIASVTFYCYAEPRMQNVVILRVFILSVVAPISP
jgi:hypothetical protein